jgi:hypothetical protein
MTWKKRKKREEMLSIVCIVKREEKSGFASMIYEISDFFEIIAFVSN